MFKRLTKVDSVVSFIPHAIMYVLKTREIDEKFEVPTAFVAIFPSRVFWKSVSDANTVYDFMWKCIGTLESDTATMSTVFSCDINVRMYIKDIILLADYHKRDLEDSLLYNWKRIYSPVHAFELCAIQYINCYEINVIGITTAT